MQAACGSSSVGRASGSQPEGSRVRNSSPAQVSQMNNLSLVAFPLVFAGPALMVVGVIVMFASLLRRRVGSPTAARLLLLGPGVSMIGAALVIAELEFDPFVRAVLVLVPLASGIAVCVAALRARIRFTPIEPT